jgi:hypothetical protein
LKRTAHKVVWALLAVWLVWEVYLLGAGVWSFSGPQTGTVNGTVYHGHTDRMEIALVAMVSGFPSGLFLPALVIDPLAKEFGIGLFGSHDTVMGFARDWLIICACGFVQWYLVLRGAGLVIRRLRA